MVWIATFALIFMSHAARAADSDKKNDSVKVELALGSPSLTITNPDASKANYKGLGGSIKGFIPVWSNRSSRFDFTGGIKYFDFSNRANGTQSEYAQYVGPGAGLELSVSRFYVGAEYYYLKARHTTVGTYSHKAEFNLTGINYSAGYRLEMGTGSIGLGWSQMGGTIPGSAVGISGNSKWSNQVYWLNLTYYFKLNTGSFFKSLFGY